jgi:hypothetical protein
VSEQTHTSGEKRRVWTEQERQALRLRRYLMAAGTSLMVIVLLWMAYWFGDLSWTGVVQGTAINFESCAPRSTRTIGRECGREGDLDRAASSAVTLEDEFRAARAALEQEIRP